MGLMRYSDREELPLDGVRDREAERRSRPRPWSAPTADGPLSARLSLPGSKSLTNRELVLAALADGPRTGHEVAHQLPWTRHDHEYAELDLFAQGMASMETKAHLDLLVAQGKATAADSPDGIAYSAVLG